MNALLTAILAFSLVSAPMHSQAVTGPIVRYSPGVMARVVQVRIRQGYNMAPVEGGYVAVRDCRKVGTVVYISVEGRAWHRYRAADCSHPRDVQRHYGPSGHIAEMGHEEAVRAGFGGRGRVQSARCYGC